MANVTLIGWTEFQAKLKALPDDVIEEADLLVREAGEDWEEGAKLYAPTDQGGAAGLIGGISSHHVGTMQSEVVSAKNYSAYVEWGTGSRVKVPSELKDYAIQFKGMKMTVGMHPQPFFFIQRPFVQKRLFEALKKLLETPR
jgi:hypothetical protein